MSLPVGRSHKKERISPGLTLYHVLSIPVSEVIGSCALSEARWILKFPLTGSRGRITGAGNVEKNSGEWENTLCALPASLKTWKKSERYGSTSKKKKWNMDRPGTPDLHFFPHASVG
jgi:hypothetical protein